MTISDSDIERFYPDTQQEEYKIVHYCSGCGEPVNAGDDCYIMPDGNVYCERCVSSSYTVAEEV